MQKNILLSYTSKSKKKKIKGKNYNNKIAKIYNYKIK